MHTAHRLQNSLWDEAARRKWEIIRGFVNLERWAYKNFFSTELKNIYAHILTLLSLVVMWISNDKKQTYLNTVITGCHPTILNLHICGRMCKFTFCITACAFLSLILPTNFQLKPSRIFLIEKWAHVDHRECLRVDVRRVGHDGCCGHRAPHWLTNLEFVCAIYNFVFC